MGVILAAGLLLGALVVWTQVTSDGVLAAEVRQGPLGHPTPAAHRAPSTQLMGLEIPEPVSIVLAGLVLFGSTTLLRRYRLTKRV